MSYEIFFPSDWTLQKAKQIAPGGVFGIYRGWKEIRDTDSIRGIGTVKAMFWFQIKADMLISVEGKP